MPGRVIRFVQHGALVVTLLRNGLLDMRAGERVEVEARTRSAGHVVAVLAGKR